MSKMWGIRFLLASKFSDSSINIVYNNKLKRK